MPVATEDIWTDFRWRLFCYIRARARSREDAEDILQEVFIKVHRHISAVDDASRLVAWLYRVTHNTIIDFYRRNVPVPMGAEVVTVAEESDALVAEQSLAPFAAALIEGLPPIYRQAVALTELEGLSQADLAAHTGLSISGAKSRVQRGRAMLRAELLACCRVDLDRRGHVIGYEARAAPRSGEACPCAQRTTAAPEHLGR